MTTTVASILDSARKLLLDVEVGFYRWADATLLSYLNDGQIEIAKLKPDSSVVVASIPLAAGIEQQLPAAAIRLIRVICNMGISGNTPGRSVNLADLASFSVQNPNWPSEAGSSTSRYYFYDSADPKRFYVSPPANGNYVKVVYSAVPVAASSGGNITIGDEYKNSLAYWICFRALLEDSMSPDTNKSMSFHQMFTSSLDLGDAADTRVEPFGGKRNAVN